MTPKEYKERIRIWKARPFSWSQLSSFEYDPEQWYKNYFLGIRDASSKEMEFGKVFALSIEEGTCEIKELMERLPRKKEHPFKVVYAGIMLTGFADAFEDVTFDDLGEVKTGKKAWDQKRVDNHGQIDMYLLMNYITNKKRPEDVRCRLHWIPTQDNGDFTISFVKPVKVHTFETKRTMADILAFGNRIKNTIKQMEIYAHSHN